MANPGKSAEVKRLLGSRSPDAPTATVLRVGSKPEPLRPLMQSGMEMWDRIWSMPETWVNPATDIEMFQMLCELLDERDIVRAYVLENIEAWHERAALRELDKTIHKFLNDMFLTPSARQRAGLTEAKKESKLEELMARKASRG
jgi:midasin (ATPase involved in ribosome maturation)